MAMKRMLTSLGRSKGISLDDAALPATHNSVEVARPKLRRTKLVAQKKVATAADPWNLLVHAGVFVTSSTSLACSAKDARPKKNERWARWCRRVFGAGHQPVSVFLPQGQLDASTIMEDLVGKSEPLAASRRKYSDAKKRKLDKAVQAAEEKLQRGASVDACRAIEIILDEASGAAWDTPVAMPEAAQKHLEDLKKKHGDLGLAALFEELLKAYRGVVQANDKLQQRIASLGGIR